MAFHQPTPLAALQRLAARHDPQEAVTPPTQNLTNVSHEWVSRLSDFGSLNTVARSGDYEEDEGIDEDEELDSLDDGLHAFREPSMYAASQRVDQIGGSILPAHDGLGTFAASSIPVQEQLWRFEQYNPHRASMGHRRRRSSAQKRLEHVDDDEGQSLENTRIERIEKWRLEQSKVLLEEVEKETRRRRASQATEGEPSTHHTVSQKGKERGQNGPQEAQPSDSPVLDPVAEETESFWQRITRRVIRDLMGIDDALLSVIFGEALPLDEDSLSNPTAKSSFNPSTLAPSSSQNPLSPSKNWEDRLLSRLARELGILVHQLSHPPRIPSVSPPIQATMDYAGIPITPKSTPQSQPSSSSPQPHFRPTLPSRHPTKPSASEHAARWGVEEEEEDIAVSTAHDIEYWERTPDLKTVFGYLQTRFSSPHTPHSSPSPKTPANIATDRTPDSLRRAAIIRQHHPLVTRPLRAHDRHPHTHTHVRRSSLLSQLNHAHAGSGWTAGQGPSTASPGLGSYLKRAGGSCASASTKKSKRDESGASRNYWDIGGSGGSEGGFVGGVGAWGEV